MTSAALSIMTAENHVHAHETRRRATPRRTPQLRKKAGRESAPAPMMQLARFTEASRVVVTPAAALSRSTFGGRDGAPEGSPTRATSTEDRRGVADARPWCAEGSEKGDAPSSSSRGGLDGTPE